MFVLLVLIMSCRTFLIFGQILYISNNIIRLWDTEYMVYITDKYVVLFLMCFFENYSIDSELLFASQGFLDAAFLYLCQYLVHVAVLIDLIINHWCEHFVYAGEASYW
jgi:hypothetical protein